MNDQLIALLRTVTQAVITAGLAYLATLGINIDTAAAMAVVFPIVMAVYYWVGSLLVRRVPVLGPIMGPASAPTYTG